MNNDLFSVLIVDDSKSFAEALTQSLTNIGFEKISHAISAREALDQMNRQNFDLLFIDIVMPDTNGIELTRIIRESNKAIKIINMSSLAQEKLILESITAGANDFIQKPVAEHILNNIVVKLMKPPEL